MCDFGHSFVLLFPHPNPRFVPDLDSGNKLTWQKERFLFDTFFIIEFAKESLRLHCLCNIEFFKPISFVWWFFFFSFFLCRLSVFGEQEVPHLGNSCLDCVSSHVTLQFWYDPTASSWCQHLTSPYQREWCLRNPARLQKTSSYQYVVCSCLVFSHRSTVRALNKNLSIAFLFPVFITLLFFQHNRTVYDIVAGTIVVRRRGARWPVQRDWLENSITEP